MPNAYVEVNAERLVFKGDSVLVGPAKLDLIGANADEIRFPMTFAGTIVSFRATSSHATIATGAATLTLTTTGGAPTSNTLTFDIADAVGTSKSASPAGAAATFAVGDVIRVLVSGANDAAAFAGVVLGCTRA